jgi:type II secretory pathway pseudopilin PulG
MGMAAIAVAGLALSAVSTFAQMRSASDAAQGEMDAAAATAKLQMAEATRQQEETNRVATEDKSDVIRRANYELGTIRATASELGAGGTSLSPRD